MSGVEAVAWTSQTQMEAVRITGDGIMCRASHPKWQVALYSQQSIDTLRAQLEAVEAAAACAEDHAREWKHHCETAEARAEAAEADAARWRALVSEPTAFVSAKGWQWASGDPDYTPIESRVDGMIARTKEETK